MNALPLPAAAPSTPNPALTYIHSLRSPHSQRTARLALTTIVHLLKSGATIEEYPWQRLRYRHTNQVRSQLIAVGYAPNTINTYLAMLRAVLDQCWRLGLMSADAAARAKDISSVRGQRLPSGRHLAQWEIQALINCCLADESPLGARDGATIGLLRAGLRRAEVAALSLCDINLQTGDITVQGKGDKERIACLTRVGIELCDRWLQVRGSQPGPFLTRTITGGRVTNRRITPEAISLRISQRGEQVSSLKPFTAHDFRRTFAGDMFKRGADVAIIQKLLGHAKPETTVQYDRRGHEVRRRAVQALAL